MIVEPGKRRATDAELDRLRTFLSFPTVASRPDAIRACARWLEGWLCDRGLPAQIIEGPGTGPPGVFAQWTGAIGRPTLLLYGHLDVVPPGPRHGWQTPPFVPSLRGGRVVARGATDDKGPIFAALREICRRLERSGHLPINVKVWIDAEEEIGSPHGERALARHRRMLACDTVLVLDAPAASRSTALLATGVRGRRQLVLEVQRPGGLLRSGNHGGSSADPVAAIASIIGRLPGPRPGPDLASTMNVVSVHSGPPVVSASAVLPDRAGARVDLRLAPDDDGRALVAAVRSLVDLNARNGLAASLHVGSAIPGVRLLPDGWAAAAARRAITSVWGAPPVVRPIRGTIPMVAYASLALRVPIVALGLTDPADGAHAANESISVVSLDRIGRTVGCFLHELSR